jgi:TRAP-type C4-dicarboxylate transport system permease large subunit
MARPTFEVDAWHDQYGTVLEVEAGTAVDARKLYQDLFEAAVIPGVTVLAVAVMNAYMPPRKKTPIDDFARAKRILDSVDASAFSLPFSSLLLIGY